MGCGPRHLRRLASAGLLLLLLACSPEAERATAPAAPPPEPTPAPIPAPPPPLGRAELLSAVAAAAASFAAGEVYPAPVSELAGRRFSIKLPFGCNGRAPTEEKVGFRYNPERQTLQLSAAPEDWTDAAWARELAASEDIEAIEGFWLRRPWLLTENCPASPAPAALPPPDARDPAANVTVAEQAEPPPTATSGETIALAQIYEAGGSRLLRRGDRPYVVTQRLEAGESPGPQGFRLVLQGRLASDRQPVRCRSDSPNARPLCLVKLEFDRIAFEDPSGKTLAEWRS